MASQPSSPSKRTASRFSDNPQSPKRHHPNETMMGSSSVGTGDNDALMEGSGDSDEVTSSSSSYTHYDEDESLLSDDPCSTIPPDSSIRGAIERGAPRDTMRRIAILRHARRTTMILSARITRNQLISVGPSPIPIPDIPGSSSQTPLQLELEQQNKNQRSFPPSPSDDLTETALMRFTQIVSIVDDLADNFTGDELIDYDNPEQDDK